MLTTSTTRRRNRERGTEPVRTRSVVAGREPRRDSGGARRCELAAGRRRQGAWRLGGPGLRGADPASASLPRRSRGFSLPGPLRRVVHGGDQLRQRDVRSDQPGLRRCGVHSSGGSFRRDAALGAGVPRHFLPGVPADSTDGATHAAQRSGLALVADQEVAHVPDAVRRRGRAGRRPDRPGVLRSGR